MEPLSSIHLTFKCPKAFNELQPCNGGWYCNGCHKMVHDFRGMEEQAIRSVFKQHGGSVCGMFEVDRIQVAPPLSKWRKWLSAAVLALSFTGLYHGAQAQKAGKVAAVESKPADTENAVELAGVAIESNAEFPGGMEAFQKYISRNIVPDATCKPGEKAFFTFLIERDGRLLAIKVMRSPYSAEMNKQITGILERSPRWKPGIHNGRTLSQQYTVPIMAVAANFTTK